jgi:hypothetical protein
VQLNAAVSGGQYNNQHVISLDTANSQLVVTLPMPINPGISTGVQASLPIAQLPGASLGFQNLAPLGVSAVLKIPLRDIVHGLQTAAPQALPNGDPIPAVPSGELPAIAVQLSNIGSIGSTPITATIYMLETYIAIYVNSPVNPFISLTLPINESGKTVGYFSTVPAKSNTVQGGFFISFQLPADVSRWIDSNFQ